jgi:transcriptional regulator with XRE-family HTH domain
MAGKRQWLVRMRKAAGFSQERLADVVGAERSTVQRWERGERCPQPWARPKLARALGISDLELAELLDEPAEPEGAASAFGPVIDKVVDGQLAAVLDDIALRYETLPSASLLAEAGQCHASIALQLRHEPCEPMRQKLHAAATVSAILMSQLVWDVSQRRDYATTMAYCDEAITHGRECGDVLAVAHAELRKSFAVLYGRSERRDPLRGLNFAQAAVEHSCGVSDALRGLSLLHVGEAYAMLGEHRQCERALSAAETAFAHIDSDDPGASFYSPTQLGRLTGSCYLFLGHPERAEPFLEVTAKALRTRHKTRSLVLGNLALAYLRQRQLEAATSTLHEAIEVLDDTRGGGGLTVVFSAVRELYPWRQEQAVHDVQDRLLALLARA